MRVRILALVSLIVLCACGRSGPLYLPNAAEQNQSPEQQQGDQTDNTQAKSGN